MIKKLLTCVLITVALTAESQITLPFSIPIPLPEYDGSYEDFGQNHLFYPYGEEIRQNNPEAVLPAGDQVAFYTVFTHPRKYLLTNNNIAFSYNKRDSTVAATVVDSLHRVDVEMYKGNPAALLARIDTQNTAVLNYFTQWFSTSGRTDVRGGAAIACQSIWPNIDLVYTSNNVGLKMFFIVYPGGNLSDVILHIKGSRANGISGNKLQFFGNWDGTTFMKPRMYQYVLSGGVVTPVNVCNASWQSQGGDNYGITTSSSYLASLPLIIEVMEGVEKTSSITGLNWSTYIGGSMQDLIYKAKSDASNNLFVTGATTSPNFPVNAGPNVVTTVIGTLAVSAITSDGFAAKFNPSGVLQWVTFVGGPGQEEIYDFDFKSGNLYCVGSTNSYTMPVQSKTGAFNDASYNGTTDNDGFIFQLSANGQTNNWLTYFGGNKRDEFNACKFDPTGALFVVGSSNSTNLSPVGAGGTYTQTYNTAQVASATDCIIMKFRASTDTLDWFTPYGTDAVTVSSFNKADDQFMGLDINGTDVYACGYAGGTNLPGSINSKMLNYYTDGILTKFTTSGALVTAKYTNGNEWNRSVKAYNGKVYTCGLAIAGMTLVNSGQYYYYSTCISSDEQACFAVHDPSSFATSHCTYLGDVGDDEAVDIQFDSNGIFYISGKTQASGFPVTSVSTNMYTSNLNSGAQNYFVAAFTPNYTNFVWSTCIGSYNAEGFGQQSGNRHCASIALDGQGFLHLCGATNSFSYYPTSNPLGGTYFQAFSASNPTNNATWNGTITRFGVVDLNTWVGIKDFPNTLFSFGLYPNPTSNYLIVDNKELLNQNLRYVIYDLQGRKLGEGKINTSEQKKSDSCRIDVSFLQQGVYLINVSNDIKTFSNKFVKTAD